MGTPYTDEYLHFRDALERMLRDQCGVDPRIIGRNEYPAGTPIQHINDTMRTCDGVIIVAYERKRVKTGLDKPGGGVHESVIENAKLTTPWNHIESAIAYSLGLPIYIIAQRGLTEEGLIEAKADWYVQKIDFTEEALRRPEIFESVSSWIHNRVAKKAIRRRSPLENFLKLRLTDLTIEEWIILISAIGAAFGAGIGAARIFPGFCH
jgi:hypothetical protein